MITYRYISDGTKVSAEAVLQPEIDEGDGITPATQGIICTMDTELYGYEHDNRYRYAGKEEQRFGQQIDLALLDFGARAYDPFTARWTSIDPLAHKYLGFSPYNYCGGNPVKYSDNLELSPRDKLIGTFIGAVTNIIPGSGSLRDAYSPDDSGDYNHALKVMDDTAMILGASAAMAGTKMIGEGLGTAVGGVVVSASGIGAVVGAPVAVAGAEVVATGAAVTAAGAYMTAQGANNASKGYNRGNSGARTNSSTIWKGKNPKERIDVENPKADGTGNMHYHDKNNNKYPYNPEKNNFEGADAFNKKLEGDKKLQNAVKKGLRYLGK